MAYTDGSTTWVAADTVQGAGTGWRWPFDAQKFVPMHDWTVGIAGTSSLRHAVAEAAQNSARQWSAFDLAQAVWAAYVQQGFKPTVREGEKPEYDSLMLMARPGRVFYCSAWGDVTEVPAGRFMCIGQGQEVAFGALDAFAASGATPPEAMRLTMDIAHRYYPGIDGYWSATLSPED